MFRAGSSVGLLRLQLEKAGMGALDPPCRLGLISHLSAPPAAAVLPPLALL